MDSHPPVLILLLMTWSSHALLQRLLLTIIWGHSQGTPHDPPAQGGPAVTIPKQQIRAVGVLDPAHECHDVWLRLMKGIDPVVLPGIFSDFSVGILDLSRIALRRFLQPI